jgi:hypothetical protein
MQEKEMNPSESLQLIDAMINKAKNKLADDGFLLIFWGWLVFITAITHYMLISLNTPNSNYIWMLMPLGGLFSAIYGYRQNKKETVKTHVGIYLSYSWSAFIIALIITLVFMNVHGIKATYFFMMILYGMATFISGGLLSFRPLIIGSIFSFCFAVVSVFTGEKELLLCLAASILCNYIVPGHLLASKFKSQDV